LKAKKEDQESLNTKNNIISSQPLVDRSAAINQTALERLTYKYGGHKATVSRKIEIDSKKQHILHRYASVPIFDKFDYEQKLEEAI